MYHTQSDSKTQYGLGNRRLKFCLKTVQRATYTQLNHFSLAFCFLLRVPVFYHGCEISFFPLSRISLTLICPQRSYIERLYTLLQQSTAPDTNLIKAVRILRYSAVRSALNFVGNLLAGHRIAK